MEAEFQRVQEAARNRPPAAPSAPRGRKGPHMGAPMELVRDVLPCASKSAATLAIALLIWRRTFLSKSRTVRLRASELEYLGIGERAAQRALHSLAECGFIEVAPGDGIRLAATLLWRPGSR